MNFLCPSCKAKYKIADEKIAGRAHARMKCKKCDHVIELHRRESGEFQVVTSDARGGVSESLIPVAAGPPAIAARAPFSQASGERTTPARATAAVPASPTKSAPRSPAPPSAPRATPPPKPAPSALRAPASSAKQATPEPKTEVGPPARNAEGVPVLFDPLDDDAETRVASGGALAGYFKDALANPNTEAASAEPSEEWFVGIDQVPTGPLTRAELKTRIAQGQVIGATLAWRDGFEDWQPLSSFPEIAGLLVELPSTVRAAVLAAPPPMAPSRQDAVSISPAERESWVVPKPSRVPQYLFLAVAAVFFGTIGFVLAPPKEVVVEKVVEVPTAVSAGPASVEAPTVKEVAATDVAAGEDPVAPNVAARPKTSSGGAAAPTKPSTEGKVQPTSGGGLLSGLSGLPAGPSGPEVGKSETGGGGSGLDQDSIQRTVRRYSPGVKRGCWEPALNARSKDAPSSARVSVSVNVAPSGTVQGVRADGDPKGYPGLARCIEGRVRSWQFAAAGSSTEVRIPFVFAGQ